jgi:septal ring factor EnvC (AmiA/AmiB activator)
VATTQSDTWLTADPWKHWTPATEKDQGDRGQEVVFIDGRASSSQPTKQKIDVLEPRLLQQMDQRLAAHVPPGLTAMDTDLDLARDAEISELKAQAAKFETWFTDVGARFGKMESHMTAQNAQMGQLQTALEAQQATTSTLQNALEGLNHSFRAELQATMESQTSRLEALLEKRARSS